MPEQEFDINWEIIERTELIASCLVRGQNVEVKKDEGLVHGVFYDGGVFFLKRGELSAVFDSLSFDKDEIFKDLDEKRCIVLTPEFLGEIP